MKIEALKRFANKKNLVKLALVVVLFLLPAVFSGSSYLILIGNYIIIYLIAVEGFDVLVGVSGQISLGHAAYYCLGAYGSVLLHKHTGLPVFLTMLIATVLTTLIGSLIAWPTTRLVVHFMSLATIAFGQIVYQFVIKSPGRFTGDMNGIGTSPLSFFGYRIDTYTKFFYFALIVLLIFLQLKTNLLNSRAGRAMLAIRENSHAADGMGVNVRFYKIAAFGTSVFYTAYAGAMFAHLVMYISPDSFKQNVSVMFLTMLLFGGTTSIAGPLIGVTAITLLNEALRPISTYKTLAYGIVLLFVIVAFPGGLYSLAKSIIEKIRSSFKKKTMIGSNTKDGM